MKWLNSSKNSHQIIDFSCERDSDQKFNHRKYKRSLKNDVFGALFNVSLIFIKSNIYFLERLLDFISVISMTELTIMTY